MGFETAAPVKVAILGGGMAALAAAFEITKTRGFEVTIHTLGWRLGGKCASSRGPHDRIEEHGIHGFLGSYYNAFPMLNEVYEYLGRLQGSPLASLPDAVIGMDELQMYYWAPDGTMNLYNVAFPQNLEAGDPAKPSGMETIEVLLTAAIAAWERIHHGNRDHALVDIFDWLIGEVRAALARGSAAGVTLGSGHGLIALLEHGVEELQATMRAILEPDPKTNQMYTIFNWLSTIIVGALKDDVALHGFDQLDNEDWSDWLRRHNAQPETVVSPIALNTVNLSYQYPLGKTLDPDGEPARPVMAAGAYLHWSLRGLGYCGHAIYAFAAGTGETVIAPMYEALVRRGVKFNFFSKVTVLNLSADKSQVASVEIDIQATLKPGVAEYQPLYPAKAANGQVLQSWPAGPDFKQLAQIPDPKLVNPDMESWWTDWPAVGTRTLTAGVDYDKLVFGLSLSALPTVCAKLMGASTAWRAMYKGLPTVKTQAFQIWLREDMRTLGWNVPLTGNDTALSDTYKAPINGHCEMHHILQWENWPASMRPKSLWYFCDVMPEIAPPPPVTEHDYPAQAHNEVNQNAVDYLDKNIGPLMPLALNKARHGLGAPDALDYSLLIGALPGQGAGAMQTQFVRANIDPTERYVQSPPGSTQFRLKPWETGFSNLLIAGDWTYTGLNVGSVECAVMSGRLVSNAITGRPSLSEIPGYPAS